MLEALTLAAHFVSVPELDWSARKRLVRERLEVVVAAGNALYGRSDETPRMTLARLHGQHGEYDHDWNTLTLDLESLHDPEKFWHVYTDTIPHEWAHRLNDALNDSRGHGDDFERLFVALQNAPGRQRH